MNYDKILRLKKYLLFVSIVIFVPLFGHLIYLYIYSDAKIEIIKGGQISEAIIGNLPSLNPLKPLSGDNKYIVGLMYRSLLKYDINEKKIKSDIVNCDLSNLLYIKCYLESNITWSNGEPITINDILATYKIYKNSDINPLLGSLLADTTIEEKNNSIIFSSNTKNIKLIDIFFAPIVSEKIINKIGLDESKLPFLSKDNLYSGKYIVESTFNDSADGVNKLILTKNEKYPNNNVNIEKIVFNFFTDLADFLKHKESINLFNDGDNLVGNTIPRFKNNGFYLPQYIGLFINKNSIEDSNLRNYILNKIKRENLLKILGEENFKEVKNPYLTELSMDKEPSDKNISKILAKSGYYKKSELLSKILTKEKSKVVSTGVVLTGSISNNMPTGTVLNNSLQEKSKIIVDPNFIDKYNFITKDDILLKGKAGSKVKSVYVNNYKLNGYTSGNEFFYYRIRENVGNIKEGINKYTIYFDIDGKKQFMEEITFLYYRDKNELEKQKNIFISGLNKTNPIVDTKKIGESVNEKNLKLEQENLKNLNKEKIDKINKLDDKYFYNANLEKLSFNLMYVNSSADVENTANYIKNSLNQEEIDVRLTPLSMEGLKDIVSKKDNGTEKNYDMILVAINLGNFDFNIFSYFHSSQVKSGYNFSNIKKLSLDILLEDLKGNFLQKDKIEDKEKQVLDILKEEQIVKILYTPIINNLVDKNIENYSIPDYIKDKSLRSQALENAYILENRIVNLKNKGLIGFIKFLINSLNE